MVCGKCWFTFICCFGVIWLLTCCVAYVNRLHVCFADAMVTVDVMICTIWAWGFGLIMDSAGLLLPVRLFVLMFVGCLWLTVVFVVRRFTVAWVCVWHELFCFVIEFKLLLCGICCCEFVLMFACMVGLDSCVLRCWLFVAYLLWFVCSSYCFAVALCVSFALLVVLVALVRIGLGVCYGLLIITLGYSWLLVGLLFV